METKIERKAGDKVRCPKCGRELVLVSRRGLWACDLGTSRRHACIVRMTSSDPRYR
jgi:ribosomal protein L37AE/L43A